MRLFRALYVTDRWDGPYRYRCLQGCEQLRADGVLANALHASDPTLSAEIPRYGIVVLFRLAWSDRVAAIIDVARRAGVPVLFDIDDLTFDPSLDELMPFRRRYTSAEWASAYGRQLAGLRNTVLACDAFIGSTPELAEHARRLGKQAHVHPNVVPERYLRAGARLRNLGSRLRERPTIGYFSGSDTHDEDFASIAPAVSRVLRDVPDSRLLVCGHLEIEGRHAAIEGRLVRLPYMHWRDFALAYATCRVTLAPLAVKNAFTDAKSALKFFEAGAFHTPTIASPVREMASAIRHDETGWLAETEADWARFMANALSAETSERVGTAARRAVEASHSAAAVRGRLRAILESYARPSAGRAPGLLALEPPDETGGAGRIRRTLRPFTAARNVARIWNASRRRIGSSIDLERVDRLIGNLERRRDRPDGRVPAGVRVLALSDFSAWRTNADVTSSSEMPGESGSKGTDPQMISPELDVDSAGYRYVALKMRASTPTGVTRAQIYWARANHRAFDEASSYSVLVTADGIDRTYLFDLAQSSRASIRTRNPIRRIRIDPVDGVGSFRLSALLLLTEEPDLDDVRESVPESGAVRLDDPGVSPLIAWQAECLRVFVEGEPGGARRRLAAELERQDVDVTRISEARGGVIAKIVRRRPTERPIGVDIVVPVFNARELVERCVRSVLLHARGDYRLVIVDDASTDPELRALLERLSSDDAHVVLMRNSKNLGFLASANRGFRAAGGRDVLLLNSDTEVFEGFLERLVDCAYSNERIGLVSPLSNNATILSVPDFCRANELPGGMLAKDVAAIVAASSRRQRPEIVTPHGFCMYVKAAFVTEVGVFDEAHFGRGFGEENDLGERAKAAGFRIIVADDVYVWHAGKGSFGDEGRVLESKHASVLERLHPGYHADVAEFVRKNPLAPIQSVISNNLRRRAHALAPAPLFVVHEELFDEHPGGVEHCVRDLVRALGLPRAVLLYPSADAIEVLEIIDGNLDERITYRFPIGRLPERFCHVHSETEHTFAEVLTLFRIGWVHIHHLMFLPLTLPRVVRAAGLPYIVTVHDYYWACPSFNLLDTRTTTLCCPDSCGDHERTTACQRALFRKLGEPLPDDPVSFVDRHRTLAKEALDGARGVVFPSATALRIVRSMLGVAPERCRVVPHGYDAPRVVRNPRSPGAPLRIAIVGQLAYASKGAEAYLSVMERLAGEDIEWHLFGRTDLFGFDRRLDNLAGEVRVVRHGAYDRDAIVPLLVRTGIDLGLLLPAWPETFSYTLSELLAAGLPVVAARLGALADRLDGESFACLVDGSSEAVSVIRTLARAPDRVLEMSRSVRPPEGTARWVGAYAEMYAACAAESPVQGSTATSPAEHRRLNEMVVDQAAPTVTPSVTAPAPEIAAARWYRYAERLKPHLPESVRHYARRRLSTNSVSEIARFRLPGRRVTIGDGLHLHRRYLTTSRFTSTGNDPYLLLATGPLEPREIGLVRFNLWCSTPRHAFAQLYWRHQGVTTFDEENSIVIPLNGKLGAWQEYVAHFDGTRPCRAWYEGGPVVELRFDPINLPGPIGLGELSLCAREEQK